MDVWDFDGKVLGAMGKYSLSPRQARSFFLAIAVVRHQYPAMRFSGQGMAAAVQAYATTLGLGHSFLEIQPAMVQIAIRSILAASKYHADP